MGLITDILNQHAELLRKRLLNEMAIRNKMATGKTARGIVVEASETGFKILDTNGTLHFAEHGSPPHKNPNGRVSPTLANAIKQWLDAKGIQTENNLSVGYAIAAHIKRYGTKQYRSGKPAGIIAAALNQQFLSDFKKAIENAYLQMANQNIHNKN
jgi:hypothetical protein